MAITTSASAASLASKQCAVCQRPVPFLYPTPGGPCCPPCAMVVRPALRDELPRSARQPTPTSPNQVGCLALRGNYAILLPEIVGAILALPWLCFLACLACAAALPVGMIYAASA